MEQHGLRHFPMLADAGVALVTKTLRLIASSFDDAEPQFAPELEWLGMTQQGALILVDDDDFNFAGEQVRVDVVTGAGLGR